MLALPRWLLVILLSPSVHVVSRAPRAPTPTGPAADEAAMDLLKKIGFTAEEAEYTRKTASLRNARPWQPLKKPLYEQEHALQR